MKSGKERKVLRLMHPYRQRFRNARVRSMRAPWAFPQLVSWYHHSESRALAHHHHLAIKSEESILICGQQSRFERSPTAAKRAQHAVTPTLRLPGLLHTSERASAHDEEREVVDLLAEPNAEQEGHGIAVFADIFRQQRRQPPYPAECK